MKAIAAGRGLFFRFIIAGITSFLVVSVMSMAINFAVVGASGSPATGELTGKLVQAAPGVASIYIGAQVLVGIITFLGSFHVLSKKK